MALTINPETVVTPGTLYAASSALATTTSIQSPYFTGDDNVIYTVSVNDPGAEPAVIYRVDTLTNSRTAVHTINDAFVS